MKSTFLFLLLFGLIGISCHNSQRKNLTEKSRVYKASAKRATHPYFTQEEFSWSLITPDRIPLYVLEAGKGPTVIALHGGFGMEHSYMRTFLKPFETKHHIVYYDQRGSLRSPVPNNDFDEYITMKHMVNDLDLLITELGEEQITLVAHSMGAVLAYEYLSVFPDKIGNIIIISGFTPKFPSSKAEFHDMFLSQKERDAFRNRPAVKAEIKKLKSTLDTTSFSYSYLSWKIQYAACQSYHISNWQKVEGGLGSFNHRMNEIIGPESDISWAYGLRFYWYQQQFDKGKLDKNDTEVVTNPPRNYLPLITEHQDKFFYLLGRYEVGDWNLRLYERYFSEIKGIHFHIFEESAHNIWMDQPEEFQHVLTDYLASSL